jgi:hypothetical protein
VFELDVFEDEGAVGGLEDGGIVGLGEVCGWHLFRGLGGGFGKFVHDFLHGCRGLAPVVMWD